MTTEHHSVMQIYGQNTITYTGRFFKKTGVVFAGITYNEQFWTGNTIYLIILLKRDICILRYFVTYKLICKKSKSSNPNGFVAPAKL